MCTNLHFSRKVNYKDALMMTFNRITVNEEQICITTPQTQDVNWTCIKRSEDVVDVFWTFYVRSIYVLWLRGIYFEAYGKENYGIANHFQKPDFVIHKNIQNIFVKIYVIKNIMRFRSVKFLPCIRPILNEKCQSK